MLKHGDLMARDKDKVRRSDLREQHFPARLQRRANPLFREGVRRQFIPWPACRPRVLAPFGKPERQRPFQHGRDVL
jgi:hypothetical protein